MYANIDAVVNSRGVRLWSSHAAAKAAAATRSKVAAQPPARAPMLTGGAVGATASVVLAPGSIVVASVCAEVAPAAVEVAVEVVVIVVFAVSLPAWANVLPRSAMGPLRRGVAGLLGLHMARKAASVVGTSTPSLLALSITAPHTPR